jgi:hypothetical protein
LAVDLSIAARFGLADERGSAKKSSAMYVVNDQKP